MKIKTSNTTQRSIPEQGTHLGRCISIIDLGTQHWEYQGTPAEGHKVLITWELPDAVDSITKDLPVFEGADGKKLPFVVSNEYTVTTSPKGNLRPILEGWLGRKLTSAEEREIDLNQFLGKECLINVIHSVSKKDPSIVYANVAGVAQPVKGMVCAPAANPIVSFDIDSPDAMKVFPTLHEFVRKKIENSDEWKKLTGK